MLSGCTVCGAAARGAGRRLGSHHAPEALIMFDYFGYGRAYPLEARQIVSAATHLSDDARYRWLNDVVCVGTGEVRPGELILDVARLAWEPFVE